MQAYPSCNYSSWTQVLNALLYTHWAVKSVI